MLENTVFQYVRCEPAAPAYIATEEVNRASIPGDWPAVAVDHYLKVVLRDDQLERIAQAVYEKLFEMSVQMKRL
jgi:hypothetical protein